MSALPEPCPTLALPHHDPDRPLVTVQAICHDGDAAYLPRAIASIAAQDLPHHLLDLQIVWDGPPSPASEAIITEAVADLNFPATIAASHEKTGYYCVPKNEALPFVRGHYIASLDADNEWRPDHLSGLLAAIRTPHPEEGWPHFTYSRREYVKDEGCPECMPGTHRPFPVGPSQLREWTPENVGRLLTGPQANFIDSSDFLIGKGTLYWLAARTGTVWNAECRRFGDWDLVCRMVAAGFRGRAVDQVSHIYHWRGGQLQQSRHLSGIMGIPIDIYEKLKARGLVKPSRADEEELT